MKPLRSDAPLPFLIVSGVFLFSLGCADEQPAEPALRASLNPVVQSAKGGGTDAFLTYRTLSFRATKHSDGTVDGTWRAIEHGDLADETFINRGVVTCLTIVGPNEAYVGGRVTSSRRTGGHPGSGPFEGWESVFWVRDNGSAATPDQFVHPGLSPSPGFAQAWCASTPAIGFPRQVKGNFIVTP